MILSNSGKARLASAVLLSTFIIGCSDSNNSNNSPSNPEPELTYQADIVWTEYGIPHVTADDWGSLGYGFGYAFAQENFCLAMKEYVYSKGESARYLGEEGDINSDLVMKLFNSDERIQANFFDVVSEDGLDLTEGYAAGLNRYLNETGVDNLAQGEEGCRGEEWVREVDSWDVARRFHRAVLRASSVELADFTVAAQPPGDSVAARASKEQILQMIAALDKDEFAAAMGVPEAEEVGSNAYAVGEQGSQSDSGVLFGNPHFPWQGDLRFFMSHWTMGDEYNAMGAGVAGLPAIIIGFNEHVAWSHTVSFGSRFTFYELQLNPENPMQYVYDGELRDFDSQTVSAERMGEEGSIEQVEHTFYFSHFGPIVDLGAVNPLLGGWPNAAATLLTYRDANLDNTRGLEQFMSMGQSVDLGEFKENLKPVGIPWFNTIAADRYGDAFYGDISALPNVSLGQIDSCIRGPLQDAVTNLGFTTMDGSDSDCEWGNDPDTAEGIFSYENLPKLETREYGANANDSYWLPNPRNLLEGYSPVIGSERSERSLRTRHTFDQAEMRLAGTDGLGEPGFNIDNVRQLHYQATNYAAALVVDDVIEICSLVEDWSPYTSDGAKVIEACTVLASWDKTHLVDSVGPHIFFEFWRLARSTPDLWAILFDAVDSVNTPRQVDTANSEVVEAFKHALAGAVERLVQAGIPMDRPWGEVQFDEKNGERIAIHGGSDAMMFSVITSDLIDGEGYSNITHGNSYIQAVTWDESDCPDAYAILTYSQSADPASDHYADATKLYSDSGWIDMPFCEGDRDAQEIGRESISE